MSHFKYHIPTDEELDRIERESRERDETEPRALAARYAAGHLVLDMRGGATLTIPMGLLSDLDGVSPAQLREVIISENGAALEWEALDVQMTVPAVINLALGVVTPYKSERRSPARSPRKAATVRPAGQKSGRPRKAVAA